ncbi:helix-turn-helix transcriptional regulator [Caenimonas soli]|uniref:helix-turn-helix transcriptional regulator n=1 Tax=Caenimonas soli TaxID=2735555 RepID=UPI001556897A|nr:YafY family protein [Caenimonas soli]NPC56673.1 YafY family transcriptional regulator [Caenimonas soli]
MSEVVRLYQYKSFLSGRRAMSAEDLMEKLEISKATLKRDIAKLRDQLHVPIKFDRDRGGYVIEQGPGHTDTELPGMWFSPEEVLALVTIQQLLDQLAPGILGARLRPLQERLTELMAKNGLDAADVGKRIRLVHAGKRKLKPQNFEATAAATIGRKRLSVKHFNRQNGETTDREISPQRLVHYRDNWYVDAWCHMRNDLRSFAIDALAQVHVLDTVAEEIPDARLDSTLGGGYGIFGGVPKGRAVLKFGPERARWVRREEWHPEQEVSEAEDGSFVLSVPFSDTRELVGDILKFGDGVEVVSPAALRRQVQKMLLAAAGNYVGR